MVVGQASLRLSSLHGSTGEQVHRDDNLSFYLYFFSYRFTSGCPSRTGN